MLIAAGVQRLAGALRTIDGARGFSPTTEAETSILHSTGSNWSLGRPIPPVALFDSRRLRRTDGLRSRNPREPGARLRSARPSRVIRRE